MLSFEIMLTTFIAFDYQNSQGRFLRSSDIIEFIRLGFLT